MSIPKFRVTVRRLMILVIVSALILGGIVEGSRRRSRFEVLANFHQEEGMKYFVLFPGPNTQSQRESMQEYEKKVEKIVNYHVMMRDKYVRAYHYPWLPVAPDPPSRGRAMRFPIPTTRRLMVVVTIAGVVLGWCHWMQLRAARFQSRANWHFARWRTLSEPFPPEVLLRPGWKFPPRVKYHFDMFMKYSNGADHPWLPIAPDPPEPR